jgi:hypothetical protein
MYNQFKEDKDNAEREATRLQEDLARANEVKDEAVAIAKGCKDQLESLESQNKILQQGLCRK